MKTGAGNIHGIAVSAVANGAFLTLFDGTSVSGEVLWASGQMGAQTQPFDINMYDLPFNNGLVLVSSGATSNCLVVYE